MQSSRKAAVLLLIATMLFAFATPAIAKPTRRSTGGTSTSTTSSTTSSSTTSTIAAPGTGTYRLDWSASADMSGSQPLSGATVTADPAWVRLNIVTPATTTISFVAWYVNGTLVRNDDIDAPYDLKAAGYSFATGSDTVTAVVNYADSTTQSNAASFTMASSSTSSTSTTSSTTSTTAPSTTTTTAPSGSLPFPGYNVPATNLTPYSGDFTTSYDGQVIEAMDISGGVIVKHKNVVIRRNRIGTSVTALPDSTHPNVSARVEWNTIGRVHGQESPFVAGTGRGENLYFYRNEVFGAVDLFNFYASGNVTIEENWAYGAYQMLSDPYQQDQSPTTSHCDGIQVHMGGAHYKILRNRFDLFLFRDYYWSGTPNASPQVKYSPDHSAKDNIGVGTNIAPMTTGFLFQQTNGQLDDIVFDGNRIDGDYYRAFSFPKNTYAQSATHVKIVNNTIVRRHPSFGRTQLIGVDTPGNVSWGNNVDENGTKIAPMSGMIAV